MSDGIARGSSEAATEYPERMKEKGLIEEEEEKERVSHYPLSQTRKLAELPNLECVSASHVDAHSTPPPTTISNFEF